MEAKRLISIQETTVKANQQMGTLMVLFRILIKKMDVSEDIDVMKKELTHSSGDWCKFEPSYVPEESSSGSQWWDFWS